MNEQSAPGERASEPPAPGGWVEHPAPSERAAEPMAPSEASTPGAQPGGSRPTDPARAYKDVVAGLTAATDQLRERDREREIVLVRQLAELKEALTEAEKRARTSESKARQLWEAALHAVWKESRVSMRPLPRPDPSADLADIDLLDEQVAARANALHRALHRRQLRRL